MKSKEEAPKAENEFREAIEIENRQPRMNLGDVKDILRKRIEELKGRKSDYYRGVVDGHESLLNFISLYQFSFPPVLEPKDSKTVSEEEQTSIRVKWAMNQLIGFIDTEMKPTTSDLKEIYNELSEVYTELTVSEEVGKENDEELKKLHSEITRLSILIDEKNIALSQFKSDEHQEELWKELIQDFSRQAMIRKGTIEIFNSFSGRYILVRKGDQPNKK